MGQKILKRGRNEGGGKGLTKSRRLELLAFSGIRQELGQRRLGYIRSVREVVGAIVIEIQQDQSRLALRRLDITQSDHLLGDALIGSGVEEQRVRLFVLRSQRLQAVDVLVLRLVHEDT